MAKPCIAIGNMPCCGDDPTGRVAICGRMNTVVSPIDQRNELQRERLSPFRQTVLDWEGARVFLEVGRMKSFRGASQTLHQSINALRRKIDRLEKSVGETLLTRHFDGVRLTAEGERVLAAAKQMEAVTLNLMRGDNRLGSDHGEIKLAVTDGLGTAWVGPQLGAYRRAHPQQMVNLICGMHTVDVLRLEADVAIQFVRPKAKDLKIVKLARLHSLPYASKSYIAAHGMPKSLQEIATHDIVYQTADQVTPSEDVPETVRDVLQYGNIVMRTNSSATHYFAIVSGVGIGMLPTYVRCMGSSLIPLDLKYRTHHDLWLVYHPDAGRLRRVQQLIAWLVEIFSPRRYPWFSDRFIHPDDLPPVPGWHPFFEVVTDGIQATGPRNG
jgi:DNA-binding transcriptional LysR family regulator